MAYLKKIERHPYIELVAYYLKELERHAHTSRSRRDTHIYVTGGILPQGAGETTYIELVAYLKEIERHAHTSRRRRDRISKWWHITSMRRRERMPGLEVIVSCPLLKMLSVLGGSSDL